MKCQKCGSRRKKLYACVTCKAQLCGCCAFPSNVGRVCPGECHAKALEEQRRLLVAVEEYKREKLKEVYIHPDLRK